MRGPEDQPAQGAQVPDHGRRAGADQTPPYPSDVPAAQDYRPPVPRPRASDVPEEGPGSRAALMERLERLPRGHPSSPFNDDGSRKPPPPDPTAYELPLPDEEDPSSGTRAVRDLPGDEPPADVTEASWSEMACGTAGQPPDAATADRDAEGTPDGSWEYEGHELSAEQSLAGDNALAACRDAEGRDLDGNYGEDGLTPAMRRIEAALEHGHLVDRTEEFALKSAERFKAKLAELIKAEPDKSAEELARDIHDGVRYTFRFDPAQYTAGVGEAIHRLEAHGLELGVVKNTWDNPEYKGVNSRWRDHESGIKFEIQFHTPQSWETKQATHQAYEKINDPRTPPAERELLREFQREASLRVIPPPGCEEIADYRKEGW